MTTKLEVKRDYAMSDGKVATTAGEKLNSINRDAFEFGGYAINDPEIGAFSEAITEFQNLPTDIEFLGLVMEQTELKTQSETDIKIKIRDVMVRVGKKFPTNNSKYKRFGTVGMNEMVDDNLLKCALRVNRVGTNLLPQIGNGLTAGMLADLLTDANMYQSIRMARSNAIDNRDDATEDRIEDGNALFKTMMDLCKIGQAIWVNTDEAKHNDYIVYDTPEVTTPDAPAAV